MLYALPVAKFFFRKASDTEKTTALTVEECLRSLVRQLSWNHTTDEIESVVVAKFDTFQAQHTDDTVLTMGECQEILECLITRRETYIMIDGLDECRSPYELLTALQDLANTKKRLALHIIICGRSDLDVKERFPNCLSIATNSVDTKPDQAFYIDEEVEKICNERLASKFATSKKYFPNSLKKIWKAKGEGFFRWIEIQVQIFKVTRFATEDQVQSELDRLEELAGVGDNELDSEYARLLELLDKLNRDGPRAMKILKLLACSTDLLTLHDLSEAITASELRSTPISADEVRQILVGFVHEEQHDGPGLYCVSNHFSKTPAVRIAHSSVLEYLMRNRADEFSVSQQNTEAALLCFSLIESLLPESKRGTTYAEMSYFLAYSCLRWPVHCRRALTRMQTVHF